MRSMPRPRRSPGTGAALACGRAHGAGGHARSRRRQGEFPETLLLAREPVAWGATAEVLTRGKHAQGPADVRSVRRAGAGLRRAPRSFVLYDILIAPFVDFEFMRRALVGTFALALGAAPIGVFLMLRRMSLIGDAMAHAILPGAAIGFLVAGLSLFAMARGGLVAGFVVALSAPV